MSVPGGPPVVVGSTLVAMVNANPVAPCIGPEIGTNINSIVADMNATGGYGAGYLPISVGGYISSRPTGGSVVAQAHPTASLSRRSAPRR